MSSSGRRNGQAAEAWTKKRLLDTGRFAFVLDGGTGSPVDLIAFGTDRSVSF